MALSWVRLDCGFTQNRKVLELVAERKFQAITVYVAGLGYAGAQELDGFLPSIALPMLHGTKKHASELVSVGLWRETAGGWEINGWGDYQPSRQTSEDRSNNARKAAQIRWAKEKGEAE